MWRRFLVVLSLFVFIGTSSILGDQKKLSGDLIIFHAGSLAVPLKSISAEFNKIYPEVKILRGAAGSRDCARKISDLKRPADIMASADYIVIDQLLIPQHASWNIRFAANEMAIVYHEHSRGASEINSGNWMDVLMQDKVAFGRSNPNADPCGYRAVLTMQLAEKHYRRPGLAARMIAKNNEFIRPKEVDLLALLESNTIDHIFLYRSVAEQHGLKFVLLPDEINLKNPKFADFYATATLDVTGAKPGTFLTMKGEPMVYGLTIPKNAPNPDAALAFVEFFLTADKGMAMMAKMGQPSIIPSYSDTYNAIPDPLKKFALPQ